MPVKCAQIAEAFVHLFPRTLGDLQVSLDRAVPPERAGAGLAVKRDRWPAMVIPLYFFCLRGDPGRWEGAP